MYYVEVLGCLNFLSALPSGRWIWLLLYLIRIGELRFVHTIIEILE